MYVLSTDTHTIIRAQPERHVLGCIPDELSLNESWWTSELTVQVGGVRCAEVEVDWTALGVEFGENGFV